MKNTFTWRNRTFYVTTITVEGGELRYISIEDKDVDADGKLTRQLNGFQMHMASTKELCIEHTKHEVDYDYYKSLGMSKFEIYCNLFPDMDREKVALIASL